MKRVQGADDPEDLISISQLMQVLGQEPDPASANGEPEATQRVPRITRMPPGVEVNESVLGGSRSSLRHADEFVATE